MQLDSVFSPGDYVQLIDADQVGEIITIHHDKATIQFAYMTLTVSIHQLNPCLQRSPSNTKTTKRPAYTLSSGFHIQNFITFDPVLDLHGLRLDDALHQLDQWIHQGLLAGHRYLRIIHGKGKGILKQKVEAYLQASELVCTIRSNHHLPGGSGVTIVELK